MPHSIKEPKYLTMVSIGLPVFNSVKTISAAIQTIINQSFENWQLIVSDNNSTDGTADIIKEYIKSDNRIKFYQQKTNIGLGLNRYFVLKKADSKYFCWHAGDDLRSRDFLEENVAFLEKNTTYAASTSRTIFNLLELKQNSEQNSFAHDELTARDRFISFFKNPGHSQSIYYSVMRTELIKKCNYLNENFFAQDWIIDLSIAKEGMIVLQKNSYILLDSGGISRDNPFKPFQNHAIELFFPLYSFHKRFNKLIANFVFRDRIYFKYKVFCLHSKFLKLNAFYK